MIARRAFTLMEMTVVIGLMGLLGTAMVSILTLATRAFPAADDTSIAAIAGESALDLLAAEVSEATAITERSADVLEFRVPDRDNDGLEETVRYQWGGAKGEPLTRAVNGGEPESLLAEVESLSFSTEEVQCSAVLPTVYTTSAEYILASYTGAGSNDYPITSTAWHGQSFTPTFPADTVRWEVTRARVMAKQSTGSGTTFAIELRGITATSAPQSTIITSQSFAKAALGTTNSWLDVPIAAGSFNPGAGLCLLFTSAESNSAVTSRWQNGGLAMASSPLVRSTSGGSTWSVQTLSAIVYEVYGTHTTATTEVVERTHVRRVRVDVAAAGLSHRRSIPLSGRPPLEPAP